MQDTATKAAAPGPRPDSAPAEGEEQASYYGLQILPPLSAVFELAVIVAALLAIDWIWPALDINTIQPNPYWLPVLLLTLQYGTASGTLAVIVAIAAYFSFVTLPEQGVGENEFAYRLRVLAQPILWIAAAVLLGQFRMVQISAKRELARRLGELETQRDTLAGYANRLRTRCDALERDIASRPFYAGAALLDALSSMARSKGATPQQIERCLAAAFPGAAVSLFLRDGPTLQKSVSSGWPPDAAWSTVLPADHKLFQAIVGTRAHLSILDTAEETALDREGLAAVPVADLKSGKVLGMLKLELADARFMTDALVNQLETLAAVIAPALVDSAGVVRLGRGGGDGADPAMTVVALSSAVTLLPLARGDVEAMDLQADNVERARPKAGR